MSIKNILNSFGLTHSWILYGLNEQSLKWESIKQVPSESMLESALKDYLMGSESTNDLLGPYQILQQAYHAQTTMQNGLMNGLGGLTIPTPTKPKYKIFSFAKSTTNVEMTESFSAELTVSKTPIKGN